MSWLVTWPTHCWVTIRGWLKEPSLEGREFHRGEGEKAVSGNELTLRERETLEQALASAQFHF